MTNNGIFTISLDFELFWGVRGSKTLESYGGNILGAKKAIPPILDLFSQYGIHATWAAVGFLFFDNLSDLKKNLPDIIPKYKNKNFSYCDYVNNSGDTDVFSLYHFAPSLIKLINDSPNQEIATHTFSHYYCLEDGQDIETFRSDIKRALEIADKSGIKIKSIVFPRNQVNENYFSVLKEFNISSYRGCETSWFNKPQKKYPLNFFRIPRFIDTYINISGKNCHPVKKIKDIYNIPASRFLRPQTMTFLDSLKLKRIYGEMKYAAKNGLLYHLWWHPHNFGKNCGENLNLLKKILKYYKEMNENFSMKSLNMREISKMQETEN